MYFATKWAAAYLLYICDTETGSVPASWWSLLLPPWLRRCSGHTVTRGREQGTYYATDGWWLLWPGPWYQLLTACSWGRWSWSVWATCCSIIMLNLIQKKNYFIVILMYIQQSTFLAISAAHLGKISQSPYLGPSPWLWNLRVPLDNLCFKLLNLMTDIW